MASRLTEQVRDGIDNQIAKCMARAHMQDPRADDVVYLSHLLKFYRKELYELQESIVDSAGNSEFEERIEAGKRSKAWLAD